MRLNNFVERTKARAQEQGWSIFTITLATGKQRNLLTNYSEISLQAIRTKVETQGMFAPLLDVTRSQQQDAQLFKCLHDSLDETSMSTMTLSDRKTKYQSLDGSMSSGLLFFKMITQDSQVETYATANRLKLKLTQDMSKLMAEQGNDVTNFNKEVLLIKGQLASFGCTVDDLIPQLFDVYEWVHESCAPLSM